MASKRRKYTTEFKAEAVRLVLEQGLTRAQASRDLNVPESVLGRWVHQAESRRDPSQPVLSTPEREELTRLRRENSILRKERDILKKAAAFFAKETL